MCEISPKVQQGSDSLTYSVWRFAATGDTAYAQSYLYEANTAKSRDNAIEELRTQGLSEAELKPALEAKRVSDALLEKAEMVYAEPVTVAPVIDKTIRTASGNITQAEELKITVTNPALFLKTLCEQNPGAVANIVKIGDGPLKSFVKTNGLKSFPGLTIVETVGVRI